MYLTEPKFEGEPIESMLKRFKKKCDKGNLFIELTRNKQHTKKSVVKRRRKKLEAFARKIDNFKILAKKIY